MYGAPATLSAGGMNSRSTSLTDPYGNYLPDPNQQFFGGGMAIRPTPEQVELQRMQNQQNDKERVFGDDYLPPGGGGPYGHGVGGSTSGASSGGKSGGLFGGFDLESALRALSGASTDVSTTVADMNQQKKGTFDALAQLLASLGVSQNSLTGSLAGTGMQGVLGKMGAQLDADKSNQAASLAASQANQGRDTYAGKQALFQGLIGSNVNVPRSADVTYSNVARPDTDVTLESIMQPQSPRKFGGTDKLMSGRRRSMIDMLPAGAIE